MNTKKSLDTQSITLIKSFVSGDVIIGSKTINFDATANTARLRGRLEAITFLLSVSGTLAVVLISVFLLYRINSQAVFLVFPLVAVVLLVGIFGYGRLNDGRAHNYKRALAKMLKTTTLSFMAKPIDLEKDYISLALQTDYVSRDDLSTPAASSRSEQETISAEDALHQYRLLLVLGEPGAGKTTLLKHYAVKQARILNWLPIFVRLTDYSPAEGELLDHLLQNLDINGFKTSAYYLSRKIKSENVLILLDGLDEVSDPSIHEAVINRIKTFAKKYPATRIVVSSRIAGYERLPGRLHGFAHTEVLDFNDDQIRQFVHSQLPAPVAKTLVSTLQRRKDIRDLTVNPLLLSATIALYQFGGSLPEKRIELYENLSTLLLERWRLEKGQPGALLADRSVLGVILDNLSLRMLSKDKVTFADAEIIRQIDESVDVSPGLISIADLFRYIEASTGLLRQIAKNTYTFWHLSFQEFFAARALAYMSEEEAEQMNIVELLARPTWLHVAAFWASMANIESVVHVLNRMPDHQRAVRLLSRCVYETKWSGVKLTDRLQSDFIQLIEKANSWNIVSHIFRGIIRLKLSGIENLFERIFYNENSWQLRWLALDSLSIIGSDVAIAMLSNIATSSDSELLPHTYRLLGRLLDVPHLDDVLHTADSNNRYLAAILQGCVDEKKVNPMKEFMSRWPSFDKIEKATILIALSQGNDLNMELIIERIDNESRVGIRRELERTRETYPRRVLQNLRPTQQNMSMALRLDTPVSYSPLNEESNRLKEIYTNTVRQMRVGIKNDFRSPVNFIREREYPFSNPFYLASAIKDSRLFEKYDKDYDLVGALDSPFPYLRKEAALTIGFFKMEELRTKLISGFENEEDPAVAAAMVISLLLFGDVELMRLVASEGDKWLGSEQFITTFQALLWTYANQIASESREEFYSILIKISAKPQAFACYLILSKMMDGYKLLPEEQSVAG